MPLRADGLPGRAFRSPGLRIVAPTQPSRVLTQWRLSRWRLLAHSCATAPASDRIPLVPEQILALLVEAHVAVCARCAHCEIETIRGERELQV